MAFQLKDLCVLLILASSSYATESKQPEFYSSSYSSISSSSALDEDGKMHTVEERSESSTSTKGDKTETSARKVHCVDGECKDDTSTVNGEQPQGQQSQSQLLKKSQGFVEKNSDAMEKSSASVADEIRKEAARSQAHLESSMRSMQQGMQSMEHDMQQEFSRAFRPIRHLRDEFTTEPLEKLESNSASQSMSEVYDSKTGQFRAINRVTHCRDGNCVTKEVQVTPKEEDQQ